MPRASCTRRPGDTASRCRGRGTYSPDVARSTSPPSPGEEPRAHGRVPRPPRMIHTNRLILFAITPLEQGRTDACDFWAC